MEQRGRERDRQLEREREIQTAATDWEPFVLLGLKQTDLETKSQDRDLENTEAI